MAGTANAGRKARPPHLRLVEGRGPGRDGQPRDSGGRPLPDTPSFEREAPGRPGHLKGDAAWLWDQVVEQMTSRGLLKPIDGPSLEVMCQTFARWRDAVRQRENHGALGKNSQGVVTAPWVGIEERASKEFRAWCAEYGITPAAEKNLRTEAAGGDDDGNPF